MRSNYLICYDICDPKRLGKVLRLMKDHGLHVEYSVFHCSLTWPELQTMKRDLLRLIDDEKDDVRIYPLPEKVKVMKIGIGARIPDGVDLFVGSSSSIQGRESAQGWLYVGESKNDNKGR